MSDGRGGVRRENTRRAGDGLWDDSIVGHDGAYALDSRHGDELAVLAAIPLHDAARWWAGFLTRSNRWPDQAAADLARDPHRN